MNWSMKSWSELTTDECRGAFALRAEVFVVEQTCPFQDLDGLDRRDGVLHLLGREGITWAVYARIMAPGIGDGSGRHRPMWSPPTSRGGWVTAAGASGQRVREARWPAHTASGSVHRPTCKALRPAWFRGRRGRISGR